MRVVGFTTESTWLGRLIGAAFLLVGALAAIVLLVPAILVGGLVLLIVIAWARLRLRLGGLLPDRSGRRNVRPVGPRGPG